MMSNGQKRRHRALGQCCQPGKKVDVVEPELGVGFVPRIPAQQPDGQRSGHLHIGGRAAGKADDAGTGDRDQRRVQVAAGTESPHVQVDEADHDEGECGRGQPCAPVVDAEVLKEKHRAPVVEGRLLQPGMAVEIRGHAGAQPPFQRVRRVEADQHLVRDLGIARLVGAHQAQAIAAEHRRKAVSKEKDGKSEKDRCLADRGPARHAPSSMCG